MIYIQVFSDLKKKTLTSDHLTDSFTSHLHLLGYAGREAIRRAKKRSSGVMWEIATIWLQYSALTFRVEELDGKYQITETDPQVAFEERRAALALVAR